MTDNGKLITSTHHSTEQKVILSIHVWNDSELDFDVENIEIPSIKEKLEKYEELLKDYNTIEDINNAPSNIRKIGTECSSYYGYTNLVEESFDNYSDTTKEIVDDVILPLMKEEGREEGVFTIEINVSFKTTSDYWTGEKDIETFYDVINVSIKKENSNEKDNLDFSL